MRPRAVLATLVLLITACGRESPDEPNAIVDPTSAEINRLEAEVRYWRDKASQQPSPARVTPSPSEPPPPEEEAAAASEPASLCWQDYCPCEPPQGGPDEFLCRRLRAGLPVDDEQLSIGAGMRDARRQLEEHEAEYGPF